MSSIPTPTHPTGTKLLIAVHGIGDQTAYETIQSVALRVSAYCGRAISTPLGRFYATPATPTGGKPADIEAAPVLMTGRDDPKELRNIGLGEAYWAPIPRQVATQKFVLEETKKWARSIAARVAYRSGGDEGWPDRKVERLVAVLDEIVETIRVMERLTLIADKAGFFKFDLGKLLVDFVGDVQLVADFEIYRDQILDRFDKTMKEALALPPHGQPGELYIVAHSEGTVITFIALLHAMNDPAKYDWIFNVRGLMTIGSPIEIHHLLWPALWEDRPLAPNARLNALEIPWHNYMDYGDPIAYKLDSTTEWLQETKFSKHLKPITHEFSRYPLPGKAHTDYWNDKAVFGHFLQKIVQPERAKSRTDTFRDVGSRPFMRIVSLVFPYLIVALLLFGGVYALDRPVMHALGEGTTTALGVLRDVVGIGTLMLGVTAAARLPRISDDRRWPTLGWVFLVAAMAVHRIVTTPETLVAMGEAILNAPVIRQLHISSDYSVVATWVVAALVAAVSGAWTLIYGKRGHYMLPALGLLAALGIIVMILSRRAVAVPVWPIVLGGALFFYLWWLSALLFDLVFIWQRYVRHSAVRVHLERIAKARKAARAPAPAM